MYASPPIQIHPTFVLGEKELIPLGVGCAVNDLDLSPYLFTKLANPDLGRVDVTWAWI